MLHCVTMCYTVLYYVTGREDQDRALQYYRRSLVTLCYTALQAGRTRTERYSITASHWLHCVTGGEDQDRALQYYRQSLVERRRYADVAPGDLVAPLNNVAMQYTRRGDFGTCREVEMGMEGVEDRGGGLSLIHI